MNIQLDNLGVDTKSFHWLADIWHHCEALRGQWIDVDFSRTTWLDGCMCAALGAILYRIQERSNYLLLNRTVSKVGLLLRRNGFLSHFHRQKLPDRWGTTIPYQMFAPGDDRAFARHVEGRLLRRKELPGMSRGLLRKVQESVSELFCNATIHAESRLGIFTCGQVFPKTHHIRFALVDMGIGIRENVRKNTGLALSGRDAIQWALTGRHTTKKGPVPGGLGLKLLREFTEKNGGQLVLVSDTGYWEIMAGREKREALGFPFPGTAAIVCINTADKKTYALAGETKPDDIL